MKLVQDLLRLVQNLALATHYVTDLLEELVMGPCALPHAILATPAYYVGTAQLMTGTPALLLLEVMLSRPVLQLAASHARQVYCSRFEVFVAVTEECHLLGYYAVWLL
jgi:hypothetical protein